MKSLYLIARINGALVALDSNSVESVVHVHDVVPVPKSNPSVAGLFALRSRVLTLIDSQVLVTGLRRPTQKGALAVITEIGGHSFGLLVDAVEDVVPLDTDEVDNSINPGADWQAIVTGIVAVGDDMAMMIDPAKLVGGLELMAA